MTYTAKNLQEDLIEKVVAHLCVLDAVNPDVSPMLRGLGRRLRHRCLPLPADPALRSAVRLSLGVE